MVINMQRRYPIEQWFSKESDQTTEKVTNQQYFIKVKTYILLFISFHNLIADLQKNRVCFVLHFLQCERREASWVLDGAKLLATENRKLCGPKIDPPES